MLKVAITGNIASGKSEVEKILREKSFQVLDTDDVVHNLYNEESVKTKIISTFPEYDILENSKISRSKLRKIVFEDEILIKKLENILHPFVKDEIRRFFRQNEGEKIAFVSVPLLFEAKFEHLFDEIILICADDEIRRKRLIKRSNFSEEHANKRIKIQMSQDKKIPLADYVIYNDKTLDDLKDELNKILVKFNSD